MKKNLINYDNKYVGTASGEAPATKSERIIMRIAMWVGFIGCAISGYLYSKNNIPMYWIIIFLALPFIPFTIFFIRHFFIKKDFKTHSESYHIKGNNIDNKNNEGE